MLIGSSLATSRNQRLNCKVYETQVLMDTPRHPTPVESLLGTHGRRGQLHPSSKAWLYSMLVQRCEKMQRCVLPHDSDISQTETAEEMLMRNKCNKFSHTNVDECMHITSDFFFQISGLSKTLHGSQISHQLQLSVSAPISKVGPADGYDLVNFSMSQPVDQLLIHDTTEST